MEILYLLIGFVVGGIIVYLIVNGKVKNVNSQLMLSHQQLEQEQKSRQSVQSQLDSVNDYNKELNAQITQIKVELGHAKCSWTQNGNRIRREMQMQGTV